MVNSGWGAIFDFDGVVVDTIREHELCWQEVAKRRNLAITHEQYLLGFGVKNAHFISKILRWTEDPEEIETIAKEKEAIFQKHIQQHTIPLVAGFDAFIKILQAKGIPQSIASSSILKNIELVLEPYSLKHSFDAIVSGEDVQKGKPDPEVFLMAAKRLNMPPERCVVFEDALYGIEAAKRAGCKVVALTTSFERKRIEDFGFLPDAIIETFHELDYEVLNRWFYVK